MRELHEFCLLMLTIDIEKKYKPIENVQTFFTSCLRVPVLQSRGLSEDTTCIKSHFILRIRTEDTTYEKAI